MTRFKKAFSLVLCIGMVGMMAVGCGDAAVETSVATKVSEVKKETNSISDDKKVKNTDEKKTEFKVGETFVKDGLSLTYVSSSDWTSDNQFIQPSAGNKFIRLFFHVDNQSGSDQSVTAFSFKCYADGYDCSQHYGSDDLSASLSNGRTADGAVYFEVPNTAKTIEVEYEYNMFSDKKVKFIFEGNRDSGVTFEKNTVSNENAYHVGDVIETKNLKISYLKAAEYVSDNMFLSPKEGNKYVYIQLEVENLSNTDQFISYFSFNCYADGSMCDGYYGMDDSLSATLSSGRKAKGTVAFEVPKNASTVEFEFEDNIWTSNKIVFLYEE